MKSDKCWGKRERGGVDSQSSPENTLCLLCFLLETQTRGCLWSVLERSYEEIGKNEHYFVQIFSDFRNYTWKEH